MNQLNALLLPNGLQPITQEADLLALDAYIRNLPMAYDPHLDKLSRRSRLVFSRHTANLLPVYKPDVTIEERCDALNDEIRQAPFPFACALLGMGEDGHFASLFPDAENLREGLDVDSRQLCIPVQTAASPHPRVSLTLSALSRSDEILLLMFGDRKRAVYEATKQAANGYPVSHLLRQKRAPVFVYWAP